MKRIILLGCICLLTLASHAQIEPANNDQKLKDSSLPQVQEGSKGGVCTTLSSPKKAFNTLRRTFDIDTVAKFLLYQKVILGEKISEISKKTELKTDQSDTSHSTYSVEDSNYLTLYTCNLKSVQFVVKDSSVQEIILIADLKQAKCINTLLFNLLPRPTWTEAGDLIRHWQGYDTFTTLTYRTNNTIAISLSTITSENRKKIEFEHELNLESHQDVFKFLINKHCLPAVLHFPQNITFYSIVIMDVIKYDIDFFYKADQLAHCSEFMGWLNHHRYMSGQSLPVKLKSSISINYAMNFIGLSYLKKMNLLLMPSRLKWQKNLS